MSATSQGDIIKSDDQTFVFRTYPPYKDGVDVKILNQSPVVDHIKKRYYLNVIVDGKPQILCLGQSTFHDVMKCCFSKQQKTNYTWYYKLLLGIINWISSWFVRKPSEPTEFDIVLRTKSIRVGDEKFNQFEVFRRQS